jgi:DnaJ-class molecular chaperone
MAFKDYYSILGINPDASNKNIKDAYRRKASESHPDKHPEGDVDRQLFQDISEAYETLVRPDSRKEYDRLYSDHYHRDPHDIGPEGSGFVDFQETHDLNRNLDNFLRQFFGQSNDQGRYKHSGERPYDQHYDDLLKGQDDW